MPYQDPADVPEYVPASDAQDWADTWNGVYDACRSEGGAPDDCEAQAFAVANEKLRQTGVMIAFRLSEAQARLVHLGIPESLPPESLHLTLAFLGDAEALAEQRDLIRQVVAVFADDNAPVDGRINGVGRFFAVEEGAKKDAFFATYDSPALPGFRQRLIAALEEGGVGPLRFSHGFTPHITLAYVPARSLSPEVLFAPAPARFDALHLAWGSDNEIFPLSGARRGRLVRAWPPAVRRDSDYDDEWPTGELCPYEDCGHDLAIPEGGWWRCGHCGRPFYAEESDSDFSDYHNYIPDELDEAIPDDLPTAADLGPSYASPETPEEQRMNTQTRGSRLATLLNGRIEQIIGDDDRPEENRSDVVKKMAEAAGCTADHVYATLRGEVKCPPAERIAGFAAVLDMSETAIRKAMERDGCKKMPEDEMPDGDTRSLRERFASAFNGFLDTLFPAMPAAEPAIARRIKDVDSWDGSASRWADTEAYCKDCLINVNQAEDAAEWTQDHCKLPIREPGDSEDTYVRQAVYAAAGGRGITAVSKPDDVAGDEWDAAVADAAGELIDAYEEMDEVAPESIYALADEEMPAEERQKQRAIAVTHVWEQIWSILEEASEEMELPMIWPVDLYFEESGAMYLVCSIEGKLYRSPVYVDGSEIFLGAFVQVMTHFVPTERVTKRMMRQADGRVRVLTVACTAVMNRVGQIDSTILFDNFVKRARESGQYPFVNALHLGANARVGQCDFVAREGFLYILSYLFDDTPVGRAAAAGYAADPDYWGHSIEFDALAWDMVEVMPGITIPVYRDGVNTGVAILPESWAAALFTAVKVVDRRGEQPMNDVLYEEVLKLLDNDPDLADAFAKGVDGTNRHIVQQKLVARAAAATVTSVVTEGGAEAEVETTAAVAAEEEVIDVTIEPVAEIVDAAAAGDDDDSIYLDEETLRQISAIVLESETFRSATAGDRLKLEGAVTKLGSLEKRMNDAAQTNQQALANIERRLAALEAPMEQQVRDYTAALPTQGPGQRGRRFSSQRPSVNNGGPTPVTTNAPSRSMRAVPGVNGPGGQYEKAAIAEGTLANLPDMPSR